MDFEKALVAAILADGTPGALHKVLAKGITPELLRDDAGALAQFEFIQQYTQQYKELPPLPLVEERTGTIVAPVSVGGTYEFWADELKNKELTALLRKWSDQVRTDISNMEPQAGYEHWLECVREVRSQKVVGSAVESIPALFGGVLEYYDMIKTGGRGILTPWKSLNEATLGLWPGDLALFVARTGVGKCVRASGLITDPVTGLQHTIEELYSDDSTMNTCSWSKEEGIHVRTITAKHDTGYKECLRFEVGTGRSLEVTPEHPYLTPESWKGADSLKPGCTIALPARMPLPAEPVELPAHHIEALALMLADGACTESGQPRFTKSDPSVISIGRCAAEAFGLTLESCDKGNDWRFSRTNGDRGTHPVKTLLEEHGLAGVLSKNKVVPDSIFRLPGKQLARFLSLFWMCDGYVDDTGPCVTLASEKLVRQLQHLLLRFGVQSSVDYKLAKNQTGEFDAWRLRVYAQCWDTFSNAIGLWGDKGERLTELLKRPRNANVGFPRVSKEMMEEIKSKAGEQNGRWTDSYRTAAKRRVAERLGRKEFSPKDLFKQHGDLYAVSLEGLRAYAEEFGCVEEYKWLWDSDLFWDTVESIESVGEQKIYDFTVEPTSCFVANDILVHNTWVMILMAHYVWKELGKRVLFATTEMSKIRIALRMSSLFAGVSYDMVRKGQLPTQPVNIEQNFRNALESAIDSEGLYVVGGDFNFTLEGLEGAIEEIKPDLMIMDGAYLLKSAGANRIERAANAFDDLKRLTIRANIPCAVTTQFNREVKTNSAASVKSESIALTDVAAWNADLIVGLVQTEDMRRDGRMIFKPLKGRESVCEDFETNWDLNRMNFSELPKAANSFSGNSSGDSDDDDFGSLGLGGSSGSGSSTPTSSGVPF